MGHTPVGGAEQAAQLWAAGRRAGGCISLMGLGRAQMVATGGRGVALRRAGDDVLTRRGGRNRPPSSGGHTPAMATRQGGAHLSPASPCPLAPAAPASGAGLQQPSSRDATAQPLRPPTSRMRYGQLDHLDGRLPQRIRLDIVAEWQNARMQQRPPHHGLWEARAWAALIAASRASCSSAERVRSQGRQAGRTATCPMRHWLLRAVQPGCNYARASVSWRPSAAYPASPKLPHPPPPSVWVRACGCLNGWEGVELKCLDPSPGP